MRIIILHQTVPADAPPDDRDVLVQAEAVAAALRELGHEPVPLACTLNLAACAAELRRLRPDVVFNLVESLDGSDRLMPLAASLLDHLRIPYTGCRADALWSTTHKPLAKSRIRAAGLPTPDWVATIPGVDGNDSGIAPPYLIKTVWEHASFGIDDDALVATGDAAEVFDRLAARTRRLERDCFAEKYVEGREFNLSLLDGPCGPQTLPIAEIDFSSFPADKPRIVGYDAKWREDSFEYRQTPRSFLTTDADRALRAELERLALACWRLFGLRGYARVDFRVDDGGRPWILEVNANPCLSPDAGFAAALAEAGIAYPEAIRRILAAGLVRNRSGCEK
ncbi:MAG: hypothetical protein WD069_14255 [Planctomycetales bacterium]